MYAIPFQWRIIGESDSQALDGGPADIYLKMRQSEMTGNHSVLSKSRTGLSVTPTKAHPVADPGFPGSPIL